MSLTWMPIEEYEARKKWAEHMEKIQAQMFWGTYKREIKEDDNVKLAWVLIDNKRVMAGVDNKTMKGYKLRDDIPSWKLPLEPLEYHAFDRWCTGFDV